MEVLQLKLLICQHIGETSDLWLDNGAVQVGDVAAQCGTSANLVSDF